MVSKASIDLRRMRKLLVDAEIGLGFLEGIANKYGLGEHGLLPEQTERFKAEVRLMFQTLGFETTAMLAHVILLTGNETMAAFLGMEPHKPTEQTKQ